MSRDDEQQRLENETAHLLQRGRAFAERSGLPLPEEVRSLTVANLTAEDVEVRVVAEAPLVVRPVVIDDCKRCGMAALDDLCPSCAAPPNSLERSLTVAEEVGIGPGDDALCCGTCHRPFVIHGINSPTLAKKPTDPPPPREPRFGERLRGELLERLRAGQHVTPTSIERLADEIDQDASIHYAKKVIAEQSAERRLGHYQDALKEIAYLCQRIEKLEREAKAAPRGN